VALLTPLTVAELDESIAALVSLGVSAGGSRADGQAQLRELHQLLMRATPLTEAAPAPSLAAATALLERFDPALSDAMTPRPRTVFRLLRHGLLDAAWEVLIDNATGVVNEPFNASTATGAARTAWRLPLLTRIEPPLVFADMPGFRDPRYGAPDECYDITRSIRLRHQLDEIVVEGATVSFGGWAALDALTTAADEQVRLVATHSDVEVATACRRLRRPDLVAGTDDALERRAWAGWSTSIDLADPRLVAGAWALSLEVEHCGISRRAPIGAATSDLARAAARTLIQLGARTAQWHIGERQWKLVVTA
jgi:hypothetical protein